MGYNSDSAADRLSAVRDSIAKTLEAQRYGTGVRSKDMPTLRELRAMEKELMAELAAEAGTSLSVFTMDRPA